MKHPRLNKAKALEVEKTDRKKDIGSAAHKLILGKGRAIKVLNYDGSPLTAEWVRSTILKQIAPAKAAAAE